MNLIFQILGLYVFLFLMEVKYFPMISNLLRIMRSYMFLKVIYNKGINNY